MRKQAILLAVFIVIHLAAALTVSAGPVLDQIIESGKLRIGTTGTQPPMTARAKNGRTIGIDADIAREIARAMDLEAVFVTMPFAELLPALENRKVDLILSGMTMTPVRNLKAAFVGPYFVSGKGILAKAKTYAELRQTSGLDTPEVTVAAVKGSTSLTYTQSLMPNARLITPNSLKEGIDLLSTGKADVLVADFPFCVWSVLAFKDKKLFAGQSPLTHEPLGIALPEDTLMINLVDNQLERLKKEGKLKDIIEKWFNEVSWMDEI